MSVFKMNNIEEIFEAENIEIIKKHQHPNIFEETNGRTFNLTKTMLESGIINMIEAPESLLLSETLALYLSKNKEQNYLYIDMNKTEKIARTFSDSFDFWAKFQQELIFYINQITEKNRNFEQILDNLNQSVSNLKDKNGLQVFSVDRVTDVVETIHKHLPEVTILVILKDLDASIEFYSTDIPYNMRYIRLHSRPLRNYYSYIADEYKQKYVGADDVDAINFAELFEKKLGSDYNDLKEFLSGTYSKDSEVIDQFFSDKYKQCQNKLYYQLKDTKNQEFFKVLLKQQMKSELGNENSWVEVDFINTQMDFDFNEISKLVEEGIIAINDQQLRFANKKIYNCVLSKFAGIIQ